MSNYPWLTIKTDLRTLVCNRCHKEHVMSICLPAPMNEYLAVLKAAEKDFTSVHKHCPEQEVR